jgi:polysaccharide deacetylase family protein (PEP-CTERM system associated)
VTEHDGGSPLNALSFDFEHWHSATLLRPEVTDPIDHIEESTTVVLDLLDRQDVRATFFIVGEVAEEYPELIATIREAGHEIASHGHTHTPLFGLTPEEFEEELTTSRGAIRRASGVKPVGFRAPNFSITPQTEWAFRVLESSDYRYDSSVFPLRTSMYGVSGAPIRPYRVTLDAPFDFPSEERSSRGLVEFPLSAVGDRVRLPIAGGFYARLMPTALLRRAIGRLNRRGVPANIYFHPWEFNPDVRTMEPPYHKRFISFHGIERTEAKLERLLTAFEFDTTRNVLEEQELCNREDDSPTEPYE